MFLTKKRKAAIEQEFNFLNSRISDLEQKLHTLAAYQEVQIEQNWGAPRFVVKKVSELKGGLIGGGGALKSSFKL